MSLFSFLAPKPTISDQEVNTGLRWLTWEGTVSLGLNSITTSGFLAAFALALGANNLQIGVLAAIPFIMQILQIPSVWIVEKIRWRKAIAVISWIPAQLLWFPIALIPLFVVTPSQGAIILLVGLMAIRGILNAVCSAAWNGWIRDLVPQQVLGRFFSRRLAYATMAGIFFSLGAAFFVDFWRGNAPVEDVVIGYTYVLLFGAIFLGLASPVFMSLMPEPLMQPVTGPQPSLGQRFMAPLRDRNFSRLMQFLFFWGLALNLAIPFFAVYMLQRLGISLSWVIALSILSQLFNILFLRIWGRFVDMFGSKSVLSVCASLYLMVILGWIFTTMPERYFFTIPLLVVLHIFAGIATAGVTLTVGTIGLKLAPQDEATSYLAGASLATNLGAGLGPLFGGLLADFFSTRQLNLTFSWVDPATSVQLPALSIIGFDFLFAIAFIVGIITLGILATLREEGEMGREVILESLMAPTYEMSRAMSSVPGFNFFSRFHIGFLRRVPVPGLDIAVGVTAYQIADMAKRATSAAIRGRSVTRRLARSLENGLAGILKVREGVNEHGAEITKQVARGAMHVVDEKPVATEQLVGPIVTGVVKVFKEAGGKPLNGISGVSQGIIQGAIETGADLSVATTQAIEAAKEVAAEVGLPVETIIAKMAEGTLQAAEAISLEAVAEVAESLPDEVFDTED